LDLRNLAIKVVRREALTKQFHTVPFGLNAASTVISSQLPPQCSSEIL
jgi:hypothetical protein